MGNGCIPRVFLFFCFWLSLRGFTKIPKQRKKGAAGQLGIQFMVQLVQMAHTQLAPRAVPCAARQSGFSQTKARKWTAFPSLPVSWLLVSLASGKAQMLQVATWFAPFLFKRLGGMAFVGGRAGTLENEPAGERRAFQWGHLNVFNTTKESSLQTCSKGDVKHRQQHQRTKHNLHQHLLSFSSRS